MLIARRAWLARKAGQPSTSSGRSFSRASSSRQDFPASGRFGAEQYAAGELLDEPAQRGQRLGGLGFDRQVRQRQGREALAPDARLDVLLAGDHPWPVLQPGEAVFHRKEHFRRRQQWPFRIDPAVLVAAAYVIPELLRGLFDAGQGEHLGVLRQVVEEGRGFLEEQRQVVLDSRGCQTAGEVLVDRAAPVVDVEALAEAAAEAGDRFLVQGEFACRQQADRLDLVDGALGLRVEGAQGLDLVVEQVDTEGQLAAHREQVDQRAADGELAVLVDRVDAAVAGAFQAQAHPLDVEFLADVEDQAAAEQEAGRRQAVQGGGDRHHQHAVLELRQLVEGGDALGNDVLVRRKDVVGQGFPIGEMQYRQVGGEEPQFLFQAFGILAVGGQQQGEALGGTGGLGDSQAQRGTGEVAPVLLAGAGRQAGKTQYGHGQAGLRSGI